MSLAQGNGPHGAVKRLRRTWTLSVGYYSHSWGGTRTYTSTLPPGPSRTVCTLHPTCVSFLGVKRVPRACRVLSHTKGTGVTTLPLTSRASNERCAHTFRSPNYTWLLTSTDLRPPERPKFFVCNDECRGSRTPIPNQPGRCPVHYPVTPWLATAVKSNLS